MFVFLLGAIVGAVGVLAVLSAWLLWTLAKVGEDL